MKMHKDTSLNELVEDSSLCSINISKTDVAAHIFVNEPFEAQALTLAATVRAAQATSQ